jgi:hypothetical protein
MTTDFFCNRHVTVIFAGAAPADYCLVPGAGDDLDFFCTDWSNELLVAAGVRNDSGDYFKVRTNHHGVFLLFFWLKSGGPTRRLFAI